MDVELHEALAQIAEIRHQMARTELFRGYRAAPAAFTGLLAIGADVEYRLFAQSVYSFDEREDWRGTLRLTVGLPQYTYYGFEPQVTFEATRTESSVALYDSQALRMNFGIRSSF